MKASGITFDELRELLVDLGCSMSQEEGRTTFAHPALGTFLFFRVYRPKETVSARDMVVVRRQLVDNGLIEAGDFERFLEKATA